MKAERYILDYVTQHDISIQQVEKFVGINIEELVKQNKELTSDEFMKLCIYLGVNPDDVMKEVL